MKFSASKALSDSFTIFTGRFAAMAPIALIFALVPLVIFMAFFSNGFAGLQQSQAGPAAALQGILATLGSFSLVFIGYMLVRTLGVCALCIAAAARQPLSLSLSETISEGLRAMLPMIGVYLLLIAGYVVVVIVFAVTIGLSFVGIFGGAAGSARAPGIGTAIGAILAVTAVMTAMFYIFTKLSMIIPVIVVDQERSPVKANSRSWSLTRGASFKIFLLLLLIGFGAAIISGAFNVLSGGAAAFTANSTGTVTGDVNWLQVAISALLSSIFGMYFIALIVAIHDQLAGPSVAAISNTFE